MNFKTEILKRINRLNSNICVGLDPYYELIPECVKKGGNKLDHIFIFLKEIIDATYDIVPAYKPNLTCYSLYGPDGWKLLKDAVEYIKKKDSEIKIIAECKRTEIFKIGDMATYELLEYYGFDASNIMPWYGKDAVLPFYKYAEKGKAVFVICHDSNKSAVELQDVVLSTGKPMYLYLAERVINTWNESGNVFIETALTYPKQLKEIVKLDDGRQFFLTVGLGAQGGNLEDLKVFKKERNFIVSASRSIIYASQNKDFAIASRKRVEEYRERLNEIMI